MSVKSFSCRKVSLLAKCVQPHSLPRGGAIATPVMEIQGPIMMNETRVEDFLEANGMVW